MPRSGRTVRRIWILLDENTVLCTAPGAVRPSPLSAIEHAGYFRAIAAKLRGRLDAVADGGVIGMEPPGVMPRSNTLAI